MTARLNLFISLDKKTFIKDMNHSVNTHIFVFKNYSLPCSIATHNYFMMTRQGFAS